MRATIPLTTYWQGVENILDLSHVLVCQRRGLAILDNTLNLDRPWDRDGTLAAHPADCHLRRRRALTLSDLLYRFNELKVLVEDVRLEARQHMAEVVLWEVFEFS